MLEFASPALTWAEMTSSVDSLSISPCLTNTTLNNQHPPIYSHQNHTRKTLPCAAPTGNTSPAGHWMGDRKQSTLWSIEHNKNDTGHGTQKPVETMRRPMENNASPGQAVYEPFSGSGTSLIAAQSCGRVCLALEIDPLYVDMTVRRWEAFSGDRALLEGTDSSFEGITEARCG
uniref:Methyltransferase n=1 Tax=Candidatus Kentrum sp. TC TaxID=2126339 RepID=A0A450Z2W1_9GAMM|nr:MAG: DNA methylase [Candidatus Kentron sp. TC]